MKRLLCILTALPLLLSFVSCGASRFDTSAEQKAFGDTLTALFQALDSKDTDAIYNLFSPAAKEQNADLKAKIHKMLSVCFKWLKARDNSLVDCSLSFFFFNPLVDAFLDKNSL